MSCCLAREDHRMNGTVHSFQQLDERHAFIYLALEFWYLALGKSSVLDHLSEVRRL